VVVYPVYRPLSLYGYDTAFWNWYNFIARQMQELLTPRLLLLESGCSSSWI